MLSLSAHELLERVAERGAVVYGTGFVAGELADVLEERGLAGALQEFVTSVEPASGERFRGRPVRYIGELVPDDGRLVLVATHESSLPAIRTRLEQLGWSQWAWAYPQLRELAFGAPLYRERLAVADVIAAQDPDWHWLAVRELGVRCVLEGSDAAGELYVRAMAVHASESTARRRLAMLAELAPSVQAEGLRPDCPIVVDERLRIVDGLHRVALAWHLGIEQVVADVVAATPTFDQLLTERNTLTSRALEEAGFGAEELATVRGIKEEMRQSLRPLVTIVLPAYNVGAYLDQCMESVIAQTMGSFEAILVDDGSTDDTLARAQAWAARDARVRVIHQDNSGVSAARNVGMDAARGTWLAFVDPDDWLEPTYLERLLAEAQATGADRVECDLFRYDERTGRDTVRRCGSRMGVPYTREEQMLLGPTASYKAITRRSVWEDAGLRFPDCPFESPAVYALVVALAKKLAYVPEPLYHYRRFRPSSLVETAYATNGGSSRAPVGVEAMEELVAGFERCGLAERYAGLLPAIATYRLSDILAVYHHRMAPVAFDELCEAHHEVLARLFGPSVAARYLVVGGFNLNKLLLELPLLQDPRMRFNFSSVIALASEPARLEIHHPNRYREMMLSREQEGAFWEALATEQPAYVFWDLVEERHDVGRVGSSWVTLSDAWEGSSLADAQDMRVPRASAECRQLFEAAADAFLARIATVSPGTRVVLVEDYLAECVGSPQAVRPHEGAEAIRAMNELLSGLYAWVRAGHPEVTFVSVSDEGDLYTDERHEYGVVPEHLNALANQRIARLVREAIA